MVRDGNIVALAVAIVVLAGVATDVLLEPESHRQMTDVLFKNSVCTSLIRGCVLLVLLQQPTEE